MVLYYLSIHFIRNIKLSQSTFLSLDIYAAENLNDVLSPIFLSGSLSSPKAEVSIRSSKIIYTRLG